MAGELVLVIDDSPTITKVVQLVLTKAGYQVETAPDGEAGLAAVRPCPGWDSVLQGEGKEPQCRPLEYP